MKLLLSVILCLAGTLLQSQNQPPITIDKVQVSYQSVPSASVAVVDGHPDIKVKPQVIVSLRANTSIDKIYLEMLDAQNNTIYSVNYVIAAGIVIDPQGFKLFDADERVIRINNPNTVSLVRYTYKLHTEDNQGNSSVELLTKQ
jgi:hypothetical protein